MTRNFIRPRKSVLHLFLCFSVLYLFLLLNFGFANWNLLLHLTGVFGVQILAGMLIFSFSKISGELSFLNFAIVSYLIGSSINIVLQSLTSNSSNRSNVYFFSLAFTILGLPRLIRRLKFEAISADGKKTDLVLVSTTLAIIQLQLFSWIRVNPTSWTGWWKFHIDIGYFESLANSLERLGPFESNLDPGGEVRYHWFAYSLIGQMNSLTSSEPFFVLTRFYPFALLFISALSMYGFSSLLLKQKVLRVLSVIILLLGPGLSIGSLVPMWSPSSMLAVPYSLGFLIFLLKLLEMKRIALLDLLILFISSFALMGSKSTTAVVITLSMATFAVWLLLRRRKDASHKLSILILCCFFMTLSFIILIWTDEKRSLGIEVFLGWPSIMATSLGLYLGMIFTFYTGKFQEEYLFFYLIVFYGFILSLVTRDPFGNQLYFFFAAIIVAIPLSLSWLSSLDLSLIKELSQIKTWIPIMLITSLIPIFVWAYFENRPGFSGDLGRGLAPFLTVILSMGIYALFVKRSVTFLKSRGTQIFLSILLLVTLTSSSLFAIRDFFYGPKYSKLAGVTKIGRAEALEPGAISYDYVLAGKWVNENIPQNDLGFTNRQCFDARSDTDNCDTRWFFASALSKRNFLIEGSAYSPGEIEKSQKLSPNELLSLDFARNPNQTSLKELSAKGVTWGWIDKNATLLRSWAPFAEVLYENPQIVIIKLKM